MAEDTIEVFPSVQPFNEPDVDLSTLITDSKVYKEAYQIFSSDTRYGVPFLRQLEMIPESFSIRDPNFWDSVVNGFGGTSDWDNLLQDAFNNAIDEIRTLVQNYYTFINGLPREQVEQLSEAGINAGVTGEGVSPSSMTADPVASVGGENPSHSQYNNEALSSGITSFVEFINSMTNLGATAVSSESIMGMLDLAEREGYNKQEVHDLMLSQLGVTSPSKYRVLSPGSNSVISDNANAASDAAKVAAAKSAADAKALDATLNVPVGNDPNNVAQYEKMSGVDVLNEVSRFKMVNDFANIYTENLRAIPRQLYAEALAYLEGEYSMQNYGALMAEQGFNKDYFTARNGSKEGNAQTSVVTNLQLIRQAEAKLKQFEAWMADYKMNTLEMWSQQIDKSPSVAPFFYKAMFDFDMTDTFYHMSPWTMGLKYGMENIEGLTRIIGNIMGFAKPKMPRITKTSSTSSGPRGITETFTETITE